MATSLTDAFKKLSASLENLNRNMTYKGHHLSGYTQAFALANSVRLKQANNTVQASAILERGYDIYRKASDIWRARNLMGSRNFDTPERLLQWEKLTRKRKQADYMRGVAVQDKLRSIKDPEAQERIDLSRKYGDANADSIISAGRTAKYNSLIRQKRQADYMRGVSAEDTLRGIFDPRAQRKINLLRKFGSSYASAIMDAEDFMRVQDAYKNRAAARAKGRYAYNMGVMSNFAREQFDNVQRFGGGDQGHALADAYFQHEHNLRQSRGNHAATRNALQAYKQYGILNIFSERSSAGKAFKKIAPRMYKAFGLEEKNIPITAKRLANIERKIPILSGIIRHPVLASIGGAISVAKVLGKAGHARDEAVSGQLELANVQALTGTMPRNFAISALRAGMSTNQAAKAWEELIAKWGIPGQKLPILGGIMNGLPKGLVATNVARGMNLDPTTAAIAMMMAGNEDMRNNPLRNRSASREFDKMYQRSSISKGGLLHYLDALLNEFFSVRKSILQRPEEYRLDLLDATEEAARSADKFESSKSGSNAPGATTSSTDNKVSFKIENLNVNANNPQELIAQLTKEANKHMDREAIVTSFDTTLIA